MYKLLTAALFLLAVTFATPQDYKKVSVKINSPEDFKTMLQEGIDLEHSSYSKADNTITFFLSDEEYSRLMMTPLQMTVLIDNWSEYYKNLPVLSESEKDQIIAESKVKFNVDGFGFGSMGGYYTYTEIGANLDSMFVQFPNLITQKDSIGASHLGRTIWAVKISDNPNVTENEPAVGMDALIHAREPQSMATLMYFMWYLLENYGTNPEVTYLVDNREIYCIPCFNPDGYEKNRQTNPNGGGMWRKNRRNNIESDGVDLNRNYTYKWGYDNSGSSPTPSSETYRGPSAGSEPETQAVMAFVSPKNIKAYFNMHSGADAYLYPWGYINQACPDASTYTEYCQDMVAYNGYEWGTGSQVLGYTSNGSARDWLYGDTLKNKIIGYTYEIGDFWPTQSQIIPIAQLNVRPLLYHLGTAGEYIKLNNTTFNLNYFNPGDNVEMNAVFKNKGLGDGNNISAALTSLSPLAAIVNGNVTFASIPARTEVNTPSPFTFTISPQAQAEQEVKLVITVSTGSSIMTQDTIKLYIGTPSFIMRDTTNVINQMWTISSMWGVTTSSFHSAPNSYTDSPAGNYPSNATLTLTLTNAVNLASAQNPRLSFWTKYDLESGWDYAQVEVTTNNGSTWTALQGQYTKPASGSFQPNGQPVYNGTKTIWAKEEMSLSAYASSQVKIRFKLRSDGSTVRDGWYVDDIGIFFYTIVPVELSSFTANTVDDNVTIGWITASELNNKGFKIERKLQGENSGWQELGFIEGSGTTTAMNSYSYTDIKPGYGSFLYRLVQLDLDGTSKVYGPLEVNISAVTDYALEQNYPNPFNPSTKIKYQVAQSGSGDGIVPVRIVLFDILGNEITTLVNENKTAGAYEIEFDASGYASGVYYYTMKAGDFTASRKMLILK